MSSVISRIAACIVVTCLFYTGTFKSFGALQQSGYKTRGFVRWLKRKENLYYNRLALWAGLGLFSSAVVAVCFSFAGERTALLLSAVPFVFFCFLFCLADYRYALKIPVKVTGRVRRISAAYIFLVAVFSFFAITLFDFIGEAINRPLYDVLRFLPFTLAPLALPWLLCVANAIDSLYEIPRNKKFVARAGQVLNETEIIRVAVVGSYGKTSVKNILETLLSARYSVVATPRSYNTPLGIAETVLYTDLKGKQVLIAEMGARRIGDVAELCALVKPDYAVFTGVCAQHIESFGCVENVLKGKCEILKSVVKTVVCGGELKDAISTLPPSFLSETEKEKCAFADFSALISGLRLDATATSFTLCLPDMPPIDTETSLLGAHSAENIALAALLAAKMGLTREEIEKGLSELKPVPHRLQLLENGGVYILDDSYNANPRGAAEAIAALRRFGGRKIVVTPGLAETGILEVPLARELGEELVGLDLVILIGGTLVESVKEGYLAAGGDEEKSLVFPTLQKAQEYLSGYLAAGDCVLFLNDLPDAY